MKRICEEISQLASDQLERELTPRERLSMWFHFLMCGACRHYNQNMLKLHQMLQLKWQKIDGNLSLPEAKKNEIKEAIQAVRQDKD